MKFFEYDVSSDENEEASSENVMPVLADCGIAFNERSFISFPQFGFLNGQNFKIRIDEKIAELLEFRTDTISVPLVDF